MGCSCRWRWSSAYRFDPAKILDLIERWTADVHIGAITAFIALMNHPSWDGRDLSSLTKVYSGGGPIAPATVERFQREVGAYIHNIYGLTEATRRRTSRRWALWHPVDPSSGALSVGVPVSNTVVQRHRRGGHAVAGPVSRVSCHQRAGVVAGYWHTPRRRSTRCPARRLHTGDIGFMDDNGWFYIVDRMKDLIITWGFKVWPREVERRLVPHPEVREAAVVGIPDEYRGETVKAFVSLRPGRGGRRGRPDPVLPGPDGGVQVPTPRSSSSTSCRRR